MKINMDPNYWVFLKQKQGFFYVFAVLICFFFNIQICFSAKNNFSKSELELTHGHDEMLS